VSRQEMNSQCCTKKDPWAQQLAKISWQHFLGMSTRPRYTAAPRGCHFACTAIASALATLEVLGSSSLPRFCSLA
jgi:hypothetical protein